MKLLRILLIAYCALVLLLFPISLRLETGLVDTAKPIAAALVGNDTVTSMATIVFYSGITMTVFDAHGRLLGRLLDGLRTRTREVS